MKKEDLKEIVSNDGESYTIIETKPNGERIELRRLAAVSGFLKQTKQLTINN